MKNLVLAQCFIYIAALIAVIILVAQPFVMPTKLADVPLTPLVVASIYSLIFAGLLALGGYKLLSKAGWPRFLVILMFIADAMPAAKNWPVLWQTAKVLAIIYLIKVVLTLIAIALTFTKSARIFYQSGE
ncbi:hypothetical protein [Piscirickettsia litoralis]|uniref:Integral membrane protein n=1 Tax=Piscirickettsia litoralis TaxID=1891921 RepID=A0ABX3A5K9_9GAMM|nr:hypothetical protein [Piscirickettsia litoralis]ODN42938.1 hypothetical protein BGC07_08400 [Piscirickettsia litoralis]